ncbi:MAG: glucuronate isomerase [Chloroflexi bacterium]|jgi:glucuronate isomerase|nr:glucuronate isomerase [Chloroflexota bacterium]
MQLKTTSHLAEDRYFDPDPGQKKVALELYRSIATLPLVCPHGHVDPRLFAEDDFRFENPAALLIIPDHYIYRMLYSQGISLEDLGIPRQDGGEVESDPRRIWQMFAEHFNLFRGTPTGMWLADEMFGVLGVIEKLTGESAQAVYDQIEAKLQEPQFNPRRLYEQFNIEVLCTTDAATDTLEYHQAIRDSGWQGRILPTFRPDAVVNIDMLSWRQHIDALSDVSGITVRDYATFIQALESRRAFFKEMGATATDHAALSPYTAVLSSPEAEAILQRAFKGDATAQDAMRFTGHMLIEMARMSVEDGLVMQLHPGSYRNHNRVVFERFGLDKGADIPLPTEYTRNLQPLLARFGSEKRFDLILFTLDETTYGRELAPLAGHYPAVKLGPPWWFYDSLEGMRRYFDQVMETAGIYNTAGFNDDTRAFPSIPARHDLWRRAATNWLAGLVVRSIVDMDDALDMAHDLAYGLAKRAYHLD